MGTHSSLLLEKLVLSHSLGIPIELLMYGYTIIGCGHVLEAKLSEERNHVYQFYLS